MVRDDNRSKEILKALQDLDGQYVQIGVLGDDGKGDVNIVSIATIHEYGAPKAGIPERSFIRASFDKNEDEYVKQIKDYVNRVLQGEVSGNTLYTKMGQTVAQDTQKHIRAKIPPSLQASTLRARRRRGNEGTTPLIDTGRLIGAISYEVKSK